MCEQESKWWCNNVHSLVETREDEMRKELAFDSVIEDKGIKSYLDMMDPKFLRNRVMMSFAEKASSKVQKNNEKAQLKIEIAGGWQRIFVILVASKSYVRIIFSSRIRAYSKDPDDIDDLILGENEVPHWMELDALYFFKYEKKGDKSEFLKKITGKQMLMIELANDSSLKGRFNVQIDVKEKMYYFGFNWAHLAQKWLNALRRAKKSVEELARIKHDKIYINVDPLVEKFRLKVGASHRAKLVERRRDQGVLPVEVPAVCDEN